MSEKLSRRDLLKLIAAATGATIISSVPNKWTTPIVEFGALPAHAQGSARGSIQVSITDDNFHPTGKKPKTCTLPTWKVQIKQGANVITTVDVPESSNQLQWSVLISNLPPAINYTVNIIDHCWCAGNDGVVDTKSPVVVNANQTTQVAFNVLGKCA